MVTHLEWSESIGKRVRTGDWADQAISTVVKIEEELRAAGDAFGLAANRRENAAQLVDYFMEEALSTIPAERWGHPVRTVDPPLWRGEDDPATNRKCQWSVWKTLAAIPEREYERIGRTKPSLPVIQPGADALSSKGTAS